MDDLKNLISVLGPTSAILAVIVVTLWRERVKAADRELARLQGESDRLATELKACQQARLDDLKLFAAGLEKKRGES